MSSKAVFGALWIATAAIAFFAGTQFAGDGGAAYTAPGRRVAERQETSVAPKPERAAPEPDAPPPAPVDIRKREAPAAKPYVEEKLDLENVESVADLSARFMAYARRKLNQGPEGQKELYRTFDGLIRNRELAPLFRDEHQLMPLAYPWMRFALEHDRQIIDMMEALYREAAKNPQWFEGLDNDPFEGFTEGLALLLPGAVDEERLERFRGYVREILEQEEDSMPKALRSNRNEFEDNLEMWGKPLSVEQMIAILQDPGESDADKLNLLRRIPPDQLVGVDVAGIVGRELERGQLRAISSLRRLSLTDGDRVALDRSFLTGLSKSKGQWYTVRQFLDSTGRRKWDQMQPLFDEGLGRGGELTAAMAQALQWLRDKPPPEYVQNVIDSYELPEQTVSMLKQRYELK